MGKVIDVQQIFWDESDQDAVGKVIGAVKAEW
jgi:hypothetical protein